MSRSLGYIRKFIIFKKDYSNMQMFNPIGHGKIEVKGLKGNISINIENAEPEQSYNVAFVDKNKSEIIGKIYTEEDGKAKAEILYNLNDLEAKGFPSEEINGILIFRDANILLGGYILKEDHSIESYIESLLMEGFQAEKVEIEEKYAEQAQVEELETIEELEEETIEELEEVEELDEVGKLAATEEIEEVEEVEEPNEERLEDLPPVEIESEEYIPDEYVPEEYVEYVKGESPEDEPIGMVPATESIPEDVLIPDTSNYQGVSISNYSSSSTYGYDNIEITRKLSQKKQMTEYILNILRYFPYIEPFKLELHGYNWWKINFEDGEDPRGFLPYFGLLIGGEKKNNIINDHYLTATDLMQRYEHYIFGLYNINDEVKFYVYGVPGDFKKEEHPHNGMTGFNTWFEGNETDGYWLLYIDPLEGKVIYPLNPMIPTN